MEEWQHHQGEINLAMVPADRDGNPIMPFSKKAFAAQGSDI